MQFRFEEQDGALKVRVEGLTGREHDVLETVRACRKGSAWACPSGECINIEAMESQPGDGAVLLTLTPRPGAALSGSAIEECLRYILDRPARP